MPRRLLLGGLLVCLFSAGCQRFENRFDAVASLCGVEPGSIQADEFFVKLESPQGTDLSAETLLTTRSRFLGATQAQALAISSRGCVRLPALSGVIQAFSSAQGWSVSHRLNHPSGRSFLRLPMQSSPLIRAELQCPSQGFYAHEELPFPLRWTSDGSLHAARFEIIAVDESQQKSFVLFDKPYGLHLTDLPQNLLTRDLPEGLYQLRLVFQVSTEAWDLPGSLINRTESCPLTVLHRRPLVGGLDAYSLDDRVAVFAKGQILPWKSTAPQSDLLYCREKRGQDLDEGGVNDPLDVCQPRTLCQDTRNFQKSGAIVADETGVFDYYAFAEDKAGNRSSISCQTLVVTDQKPALQLLWSESAWNQAAAQMTTPRAQVQLRINGQHPQLQDASLSTRYQCKADFVRADQSVLSGRSLVCTSGRCRNKTLEQYTPCDADLNLSLTDLWPQLKAGGGVLRIFVQADDRAGHSAEQMATIGIQPQRWTPTRRTLTTNLEDATSQLLQDHKGRIFSMQSQFLFLWEGATQRWQYQASPLEDSSSRPLLNWLSREGELYTQWTAQDGFPIYRWTETGWQSLPGIDSQGSQECLRAQSFHRGGFWCATATGFAIFENEQWSTLPLPAEAASCPGSMQAQSLWRDQTKTLWLHCRQTLFQKQAGSSAWTAVTSTLPLLNFGIDQREHHWTVRGTGRDDLFIQRTKGAETKTLPLPPSWIWLTIRPQEFLIGPSSEVILGDAYWDFDQDAWQVFPYLAQRRLDQRLMPRFFSNGEIYWETEQGLLQWDGHGLRHWDFAVHGLKIATAVGRQAVLGDDSAPWILASPGGSYEFPFQFQMRNWVHFPKTGLAPSSSINGLWIDEQSRPQVYVPDDGLYTLQSDGWSRSLPSPGLSEELPLETPFFEPILMNPQGIYRWTLEQSWTRVIPFAEPRYFWGGTPDAQGRYWLYQDSGEIGVIDGQQVSDQPLPQGAGSDIRGIFRRRESIVVATNEGLFSRQGDASDWQKQTWQDWGLDSIDRVRQIDADRFLVSITDGFTISQLWLLDLSSSTKTAFVRPDPAHSLGGVLPTSRGDFIMAIQFDIYRTDGVSLTKIFAEKDLRSLVAVSGTFLQISHMKIDAHDRIWFHIGSGVVRIDL